jgi:RNA polymerase sigma factor (sigma-70 family)
LSETNADLVRDLGHSARVKAALTLSDAHLLEQYALFRNETAFEALLYRHGALVFSACRRILFDVQDAEDAFQATFLILARKAGSIRCGSMLSNWLYGVAFRVATRARKCASRRRVMERSDFDWATVADPAKQEDLELAPLLQEQLQRLPDKYRAPVVLCYLEGKTNEEAADELQWPVGTLKTRLHKAREILRTRLGRRGVVLTAGLLAANALSTPAPAALIDGTFQAALAFAAGNAMVGGAASAQALTLARGVLRAMLLVKLKGLAAAVLALAVVAGVGGLAYHGLAVEPAAKDDQKADKPKQDKDAILGVWKVETVEEDGKDASETDHGKVFKSKPWTITADKIVLEGVFEMNYKLDPAAKPKAIDVDNGGDKTFNAVYSLDGNTLKICAPIMPGGDRPGEVASKEGSQTRLLVLKRQVKNK